MTSPGTTTSVGLALEQHLLDADERAGGLLGVRAGADAEEDVGRRQPELVEEDVGHLRVVVLAGVDERDLGSGLLRARGWTGAAFMKFGRAPTTKQISRGAPRHRVSVQSGRG